MTIPKWTTWIIYNELILTVVKNFSMIVSSKESKFETFTLYHTYRGMTMHSPAAALISVRCGRDNVCVATLEQR